MVAENTISSSKEKRLSPTTAVLLLLPLVVLGGVILLFLSTGGGLRLSSPAPVEDLTIERTVLDPGSITITVPNIPGLAGMSMYGQALLIQYPTQDRLTNVTADVIWR